MKHLVLKPFVDGNQFLNVGSHFESKDTERLEHLAKHGFIKYDIKPKAKVEEKVESAPVKKKAPVKKEAK